MKTKREWLIKHRGNKTQQEIADAANIDRSYYCQIETGDRDPSVDTAKKIGKVFGFDWTIFFESQCGDTRQNKAQAS